MSAIATQECSHCNYEFNDVYDEPHLCVCGVELTGEQCKEQDGKCLLCKSLSIPNQPHFMTLIPDINKLKKLPKHKVCDYCEKDIGAKPEGQCQLVYSVCDECEARSCRECM